MPLCINSYKDRAIKKPKKLKDIKRGLVLWNFTRTLMCFSGLFEGKLGTMATNADSIDLILF